MVETFAYEARNPDGQLVAGTIAADTLEQAGRLLGDRELFVVRLAIDRAVKRRSREDGRATRPQVAWCISQLSVMVETGVRLGDALEYLARQASDPKLKRLLQQVSRTVHEGRSFSEALEAYPRSFPPSLVALIRASEMSGTMGQVLRRASDYLMHDLQVLRRMRSALMYPAFMFTLCLAVTVFLLIFILPRFEAIFASRQSTLPGPTRALMALSDSIVRDWYLWGGAALLLGGAAMLWRGTAIGRRQLDVLSLRVPVVSNVMHKLCQSRMFRAMAILLDAGVPLIDAIDIVKEVVANHAYKALWVRVDEHIRHGENLSTPLLASPLVPESVTHMIESGERSGRLPFVFARLADFIEDEYDRAVKTATQFIEPCMILCMGGIVGFIAAALMLPLFQASQVAGR